MMERQQRALAEQQRLMQQQGIPAAGSGWASAAGGPKFNNQMMLNNPMSSYDPTPSASSSLAQLREEEQYANQNASSAVERKIPSSEPAPQPSLPKEVVVEKARQATQRVWGAQAATPVKTDMRSIQEQVLGGFEDLRPRR